MTKALPGEHLCATHQGNHSHYAEHNCVICKLTAENAALREQVERMRLELQRWSDGFVDDAVKYTALREENEALRAWKASRLLHEGCNGHMRGDPPAYVPECTVLRAENTRLQADPTFACQSWVESVERPLREEKDELAKLANALLHQIDINDFQDSHGHSAKIFKAVHDLMYALAPTTGEKP